MLSFKWHPNTITKLNTKNLIKEYLVPGRFRRYTEKDILNDHERAWVNAKLHERLTNRIQTVKIKATAEIISAYKTAGILEVSRTLDYPPWPLFIAITKKWQNLTKYDLAQKKIAMLNDIQSPYSQILGRKNADKFEEKVIKFFKKKGVRLKTEEDLKKDQIEKYGRPIWTVDLWFADNPIKINGHTVHWIECKNYMYTDVGLFQRSVLKQVTKYREQWGTGAIVFSHGFTVPITVPGVLLLDGYHFISGRKK
jgi:Protein of unknown function TPD sequence-motif